MHGRGEQAVEEAELDVGGHRDPGGQAGEDRALDDRPGDDEGQVGLHVREAAKALGGARAAGDDGQQHQRQHERRHQQLRAAELDGQRAAAERRHDAVLLRHGAGRLHRGRALEVRAGDGHEDVVERGRLDLDELDLDARLVERPHDRRDRRVAGRRADADAGRRALGRALDRAEPGERLARAARVLGVGHLDVHGRLPHARLQRLRRALGHEVAAVDDPDAVGELLGLLEVLRGEEDGRAVLVQRAHLAPKRGAAGRVQAGGRLVEEQHVRAVHERQRQVEPAPHAARVAADAPVAGLGEADAVEQLHGPLARLGPRRPCSAPCIRSSSRPVISGSMAASWSATPIARRTASPSLTTSWPATRARPAVGRSSVVRMRTTVVLPAPLGPRNP